MLQYTQNEAAKTRETNHNIIWRANLISKISLSFSPSGANEKERKRESERVEEELWERGCWAIAHVQYRSRAVWEAEPSLPEPQVVIWMSRVDSF